MSNKGISQEERKAHAYELCKLANQRSRYRLALSKLFNEFDLDEKMLDEIASGNFTKFERAIGAR